MEYGMYRIWDVWDMGCVGYVRRVSLLEEKSIIIPPTSFPFYLPGFQNSLEQLKSASLMKDQFIYSVKTLHERGILILIKSYGD